MSDLETYRRMLELRNDGIPDAAMDGIRDRMRTLMIRLLEDGIEEINRLPDDGRLEAKRRAEIRWWQEIVRPQEPPQ
jgi:hypothetical protein